MALDDSETSTADLLEILRDREMALETAGGMTAGTKGAWAYPTATVGAQVLPAIAMAIPGKYERQLRKRHEIEGGKLPGLGQLTSEDIAAGTAAEGSYERQARALEARGSATGGMSGLDREKAFALRKEGRTKRAAVLSSRRKVRLGQLAAAMKKYLGEGEQLGAMSQARKQALWGGISSAATSKATGKAMKQFGDISRERHAERILSGTTTPAQRRQQMRAAAAARGMKTPAYRDWKQQQQKNNRDLDEGDVGNLTYVGRGLR